MAKQDRTVTAGLSSPLKISRGRLSITKRTHALYAEDSTGALAMTGDTRSHYPDRFVCTTRSGFWRILAPAEQNGHRWFPVLDPAGREAARIEFARREKWTLALPTGEREQIRSTAGMIRGFTCDVGTFAHASTRRFGPGGGIRISFDDGVLRRPDAEVIMVACVWMADSEISSRVADYANAGPLT